MPRFFIHISVVLLGVISACTKSATKEDTASAELARAGDRSLLLQDIPASFFVNLNARDSLNVLRDFSMQWARKQAILIQAEQNLPPEAKNKQRELEQYLNDLLIYEYQQLLIGRLLDTVVNEDEIERYYRENPENFELKENIVRLVFFKFPVSVPQRDQLWKAFERGKEKDLEMLTAESVRSGGNFFRDDNLWLRFSDILKEIPIVAYNEELFLQNNKVFRIRDDAFDYFVHIKNFKMKNSLSPLEFEQDRIREIILNRRKNALLAEMERKIFQDALKKGEVKLMLE